MTLEEQLRAAHLNAARFMYPSEAQSRRLGKPLLFTWHRLQQVAGEAKRKPEDAVIWSFDESVSFGRKLESNDTVLQIPGVFAANI